MDGSPLEGTPFTVKDSYRDKGRTVTSGAPVFKNLTASDDANTPPMAYGGMLHGIYGRTESPYSEKWRAAAYEPVSSNGSGVATAAAFSAFGIGIGEETVSSGQSPGHWRRTMNWPPTHHAVGKKIL